MKICYRCKRMLSVDNFGKCKRSKDGLRGDCKECKRKESAGWRNKNKKRTRKKEWYEKNKDRIIKKKKDRYHTDDLFNITYRLRNRLTSAVRNNSKSGSAIDDLGCSIKELRTYLESLFTEGMNWELLLCGKIHIDHIVPLSSFDLTDRDQIKIACNYKNLQPLWAEDNLKKGSKIPNKDKGDKK